MTDEPQYGPGVLKYIEEAKKALNQREKALMIS